VTLWASSSAPDTDFTASCDVVKPDGETINLNDGIVRAAFRDSSSAPTPITPGVPYEYRIAVWPTSYEFSAGDRIRIEISSSDYPQFAPNPNTGEPFGQSAATRPADKTVLHDAADPSSVALPVIPG
jgi:putative CocE/NonD family hydrolase